MSEDYYTVSDKTVAGQEFVLGYYYTTDTREYIAVMSMTAEVKYEINGGK